MTAKLLQHFHEILAVYDQQFKSFKEVPTHNPVDQGPLADFLIPPKKQFFDDNSKTKEMLVEEVIRHLQDRSNHEAFANDLLSTRWFRNFVADMYKSLLELKLSDHKMALLGKKLQTQSVDVSSGTYSCL